MPGLENAPNNVVMRGTLKLVRGTWRSPRSSLKFLIIRGLLPTPDSADWTTCLDELLNQIPVRVLTSGVTKTAVEVCISCTKE